MAEAVVEDRAALPSRFFCHLCKVEISIPNTDYICPLCAGGFVEELPPNAVAPGTANPTANSSSTGSGTNNRHDRERAFENELDLIRGEIASLLMSRNGPHVRIALNDNGRPRRVRGNGTADGGVGATTVTLGGGIVGGGGQTGGGRVRQHAYDRLDNILIDLLQSISSGDIDGAGFPGQSHLFFMGNPGDYAWGREGIDTIVTQLLNQMETSGPPPLPKELIDSIPKVEVQQEEIDNKTQCSVCWEDFKLGETVRKLRCSHIYHENCIVPWLNLHGTCPICRKAVMEEYDSDYEEATMMDIGDIDGGGSEQRNAQTNTVGNAAQPQQNSAPNANRSRTSAEQIDPMIFTFDDSNVDLD